MRPVVGDPDEHFVVPGSGKLGESLENTHSTFETPCGAYAHFKIARYLMRITRNPMYGDTMERVLFNIVLGATPLQRMGPLLLFRLQFPGTEAFFGENGPAVPERCRRSQRIHRISAASAATVACMRIVYTPSTATWTVAGESSPAAD